MITIIQILEECANLFKQIKSHNIKNSIDKESTTLEQTTHIRIRLLIIYSLLQCIDTSSTKSTEYINRILIQLQGYSIRIKDNDTINTITKNQYYRYGILYNNKEKKLYDIYNILLQTAKSQRLHCSESKFTNENSTALCNFATVGNEFCQVLDIVLNKNSPFYLESATLVRLIQEKELDTCDKVYYQVEAALRGTGSSFLDWQLLNKSNNNTNISIMQLCNNLEAFILPLIYQEIVLEKYSKLPLFDILIDIVTRISLQLTNINLVYTVDGAMLQYYIPKYPLPYQDIPNNNKEKLYIGKYFPGTSLFGTVMGIHTIRFRTLQLLPVLYNDNNDELIIENFIPILELQPPVVLPYSLSKRLKRLINLYINQNDMEIDTNDNIIKNIDNMDKPIRYKEYLESLDNSIESLTIPLFTTPMFSTLENTNDNDSDNNINNDSIDKINKIDNTLLYFLGGKKYKNSKQPPIYISENFFNFLEEPIEEQTHIPIVLISNKKKYGQNLKLLQNDIEPIIKLLKNIIPLLQQSLVMTQILRGQLKDSNQVSMSLQDTITTNNESISLKNIPIISDDIITNDVIKTQHILEEILFNEKNTFVNLKNTIIKDKVLEEMEIVLDYEIYNNDINLNIILYIETIGKIYIQCSFLYNDLSIPLYIKIPSIFKKYILNTSKTYDILPRRIHCNINMRIEENFDNTNDRKQLLNELQMYIPYILGSTNSLSLVLHYIAYTLKLGRIEPFNCDILNCKCFTKYKFL